MARMSLEFDGFKELAYRISEIEDALKPAVDEALTEVQRYVQTETQLAAARYVKGGTQYSTGKMVAAIKPVEGPTWVGTTASVGVGFDIRAEGGGGMHSIWIMYGTPRIKKDVRLYRALRGRATEIKIQQIMQEALDRHVRFDHEGAY